MQYGYFDDLAKEYVITRPDTPKSWSNYLGSTDFGAIITNNAGGYGFYKSGAQGRFLRLRFNAVPMDQPGRYLYLHDHDSKDFWSASWQPVGKPLDSYKSECRHGTGYTIIKSEYDNIATETTYFVPKDRTFECWRIKIKNNDNKPRRLSLFSYVEYVGNWNAIDDQVNLQYTQYTVKMSVYGNIIDHGTNVNIPAMPDNFEEKDQGRHTFLALTGADIKGYDTDREAFIGPYRDYSNPIVVEQGQCSNSEASGDNACGTLQAGLELAAGEERECLILLGIGEAQKEGRQVVEEFSQEGKVDQELQIVKSYWHERMQGMSVETPDKEFDSMLNTWAPYNCLITYNWARAASLVYAGERDGLGYRDAVQDLLGVMHNITEEAVQRLELLITGQVSTGGAMPIVKPFAHKPGHEKLPAEEEYRSDDCLWLFNAVQAYVKETGDMAFFDKVLPYADKGEDTVLGHLRRAIQFNLDRSGAHQLPCGLLADWNDCLELGHNGETVFVAMQLRYALATYIEISERLERQEERDWAQSLLKQLDETLAKDAWDGEWYLRAYRDDGLKFGSNESDEGFIFLNPQSWSVLSGHATGERAKQAMASVRKHLATEYGIMVCTPPFIETDYTVIRATLMNPGMKENGGIFTHTQGWAIIAECMLGNGNQAYDYFRAYMPASYNTKAEIRQIEPYVYCQSTHSKASPHYGASRVPWLTGAATWSYYSVIQYMLGIHPDFDGLRLDPCIPNSWREFKVDRNFRGKSFHITINNDAGVQKGVSHLVVNGEVIEDNLIPLDKMKAQNNVTVIMG